MYVSTRIVGDSTNGASLGGHVRTDARLPVVSQHCHQEPPAVKAAIRGDLRTQRLASRLVGSAGNWTGRIVGNVAWAYAVLQHGPPTIMDIVRTTAVHLAN